MRGGGKSRDVISISVTGEVGADERGGLPAGATEDEGYSLRLETNEFLTELARGLSEENEGLLALVRRTVDGLRDMSGLERGTEDVNGAGADRHAEHNGNNNADVVVMVPQKSADELAIELEGIMEHLRTILTNPSFVPIEEVEVREEAINRLRAGLETMESRWKDAVHMIDGWRNRMVSSGKSVDIDDLRMGLRLSPVRVRDVKETEDVVPVPMPMRLSCVQEEEEEEEYETVENGLSAHDEVEEESQRQRSPSPVESLHLVPAPGYEAEPNESDGDSSSIFEDDIDIDELDAEEPNVQVLQESTYAASLDSPPLPEPPQLSPLKDSNTSGNRGPAVRDNAYRKRPGDFTTIVEENTWDLKAEEEQQAPAPPPHLIKPQSPQQKKTTTASKRSPQAQEQTRPSSTSSYDSPLFGRSGERPSQMDPSRKLFSKPKNSSPPTQTKSQPEPGTKNTPARTKSSRRPNSSRSSPDPGEAEIKRTASDPTNPPGRQQTQTSTSSRQTPAATQSRPTSSSSIKSVASTTQQQQQSQPSIPRPRSPVRTNQPTIIAVNSSRLPRPNTGNQPPQSPLTMATIAAKLAASEREADAARVRAKLRAVRGGGQRRNPALAPPTTIASTNTNTNTNSPSDDRKAESAEVRREEKDYGSTDPVKKTVPPRANQQESPAKEPTNAVDVDELAGSIGAAAEQRNNGNGDEAIRVTKRRRDHGVRRTSRAASRRRSTLSPWELETLIQGNAAGPAN